MYRQHAPGGASMQSQIRGLPEGPTLAFLGAGGGGQGETLSGQPRLYFRWPWWQSLLYGTRCLIHGGTLYSSCQSRQNARLLILFFLHRPHAAYWPIIRRGWPPDISLCTQRAGAQLLPLSPSPFPGQSRQSPDLGEGWGHKGELLVPLHHNRETVARHRFQPLATLKSLGLLLNQTGPKAKVCP